MVSPNSGRKPITDGPKKSNRLKDFAAVGLDQLLDLMGGQVFAGAQLALGGRRGMTVQFTVVGAIGRRIAFPAVHISSRRRLFINQTDYGQSQGLAIAASQKCRAFDIRPLLRHADSARQSTGFENPSICAGLVSLRLLGEVSNSA